ncbi:class V aminotransferase [Stappia sp. 22II-S9-Z10]|nr:class V aminotransferase [Stappia sp. 22II-S9-Z10]
MSDRLYLDWNASAPATEAARDAAVRALLAGGNASSVHAEGRACRGLVETTRRALGARFGLTHEAVTFTSGGTEANAMALRPGVAREGAAPAERLITQATEHPAVLSGGGFAPADVTVLPVDAAGRLDAEDLAAALAADPRPALVSLMAANNETGVVTDPALFDLARAAGAVTHTDAVQGFGRVPDATLCADLVTLSGHKIGAPQGVGALVKRPGITVAPLIRGGGQERGARGGTENVPAIAGLGAALAGPAADPDAWQETRRARDTFEASLLAMFPRATIFGREAPRLPNTSLFALGAPAELALIGLDLAGVAVSSGSACSSGKVSVSHVLIAMGVSPDVARCAIRVSCGPVDAGAALERFLVALQRVIVPMTT